MSKLYNWGDYFFDHSIITGTVVFILAVLSTIGLIITIQVCNFQYSEYQMKLEIEKTKQKAVICQETGYCDSKNINIDYQKEANNE